MKNKFKKQETMHPIGYLVLFSVLFWISVMVLQGVY